jgi:TctA family transporter
VTALKSKLRIHPDVVISIIAILFSGVLAYEIMDYPQEARLFPLVFLGFFTLFMVIVLVLGNMAEIGYRQSLIMAKGSVLTYFLGRPICLVLIALIVISLLIPAVKSFRKAK